MFLEARKQLRATHDPAEMGTYLLVKSHDRYLRDRCPMALGYCTCVHYRSAAMTK